MTTEVPPVTVTVACFNHERFVEQCLDSVAEQHYPNLQLIITDDASTDSSVNTIQGWLDRTGAVATFIAHERNRGLTPTLNEARAHADGRYVTYIAADDLMEPGRLRRQVVEFEAFPESVAALYSDAYIIDEDGLLSPDTIGQRAGWSESPPEGDIFEALVRINFIPAPSVIMRRSALDAVGPYDENLLFEDWDTWLRLADQFEFRCSPFIGVRYRLVATSVYHTRRTELAQSKVAMLNKWLDHPVHRAAVVARLRNEVHHLYDLERSAALPHLRSLCDLQPGLNSRLRYLLARIGMSYRTQQHIVKLRRGL